MSFVSRTVVSSPRMPEIVMTRYQVQFTNQIQAGEPAFRPHLREASSEFRWSYSTLGLSRYQVSFVSARVVPYDSKHHKFYHGRST